MDLSPSRQGCCRDVQAANPHGVELGRELLRDDGRGLGQKERIFPGRRRRGTSTDERQDLLARSRTERTEQEKADGNAANELGFEGHFKK